MTGKPDPAHPQVLEVLRLLKYGYRLGVLRGPLIWARLQFSREAVAVTLPSFRSPILVRPHTTDVWTFEKIFISREYDLSFLRADPQVIIDAGANVGYASVYFAHQYPAARILAIEPEATNFALLQRNTESYRNVTPVRAALWPRCTQLAIENPGDPSWAFRVREVRDADGESVRGISVPELLDEYHISRIDLLKIDIEGAEKELFQPGCETWLEKTRILVIELHDWLRDGCGTAFYRATSQFPFRHFTSGENAILVRLPTDAAR